MAWPDNITRVPVVHHVTNYAGDPIVGKATFTPPAGLITDLTTDPPTQVAPSEITGTYVAGELLAADGVSALTLPALNDPDVLPNGGRYTVTLKFSNATSPAAFYIEVDYQADEYDLATVVHQPGPSGGTIIVVPGDLSAYQTRDEKGEPSGYAGLDVDGDVVDADGNKITGGGSGDGTVTSVAGVDPDGTGNVPLTAADIDAATTEDLASGLSGKADTDDLDSLPYAKTVNTHGPDGSGNITLTAANIGAATVPVGITDGQAIGWDGTNSTTKAVDVISQDDADVRYLTDEDGTLALLIAASEPVLYEDPATNTWPDRSTVCLDPTKPVKFSGWDDPDFGDADSGLAIDGVDFFRKVPPPA